MPISLTPIGCVSCTRTKALDDNWDQETTTITLDKDQVEVSATAELASFSHIEVIFYFDQVSPEKIQRGSRRPRNNANWPEVGILAQRGKNRPNQIGLTTCRLLGVDGYNIVVHGLDAIDGTPVLDIKPVMREFLPRGEVSQPAWATEIMAAYW